MVSEDRHFLKLELKKKAAITGGRTWCRWWNGSGHAGSSLQMRVFALCFALSFPQNFRWHFTKAKLSADIALLSTEMEQTKLFLCRNHSPAGVTVLGIASKKAGPDLQICLLVWYWKAAFGCPVCWLSSHIFCFFLWNKLHTGSDESQTVLLLFKCKQFCEYLLGNFHITAHWRSNCKLSLEPRVNFQSFMMH